MFVYELSGCGFEFRCCHLNFKYRACFWARSSLTFRQLIECRFTLNCVRGMIKTYSLKYCNVFDIRCSAWEQNSLISSNRIQKFGQNFRSEKSRQMFSCQIVFCYRRALLLFTLIVKLICEIVKQNSLILSNRMQEFRQNFRSEKSGQTFNCQSVSLL